MNKNDKLGGNTTKIDLLLKNFFLSSILIWLAVTKIIVCLLRKLETSNVEFSKSDYDIHEKDAKNVFKGDLKEKWRTSFEEKQTK
jgi:hypothetical protein